MSDGYTAQYLSRFCVGNTGPCSNQVCRGRREADEAPTTSDPVRFPFGADLPSTNIKQQLAQVTFVSRVVLSLLYFAVVINSLIMILAGATLPATTHTRDSGMVSVHGEDLWARRALALAKEYWRPRGKELNLGGSGNFLAEFSSSNTNLI